MVGARPSTPDDAAAVAELRALAVEDARAKRGGDGFVDGALRGEGAVVEVVGCIGDDVVGYAEVRQSGAAAVVDALFTHPGARGVGVGHAMLGQVVSIAQGWGCTELDSYALPGDRDTKNFFESHGMKSRLLVVRRSL